MQQDGDIDYSTYSLSELYEISKRIDADKYPRNFHNLSGEIERRRAAEDTPQNHESTGPVFPAIPTPQQTILDRIRNLGTAAKVGIGCAIAAFALAGIVVAVFALAFFTGARNQAPVEEFLSEAIPTISSWDPEGSSRLFAPEAREQVDPDDLRRLFKTYAELGELKSFDTPRFLRVSSSTEIPYRTVLTYDVEAEYSAGGARLTFELVRGKTRNLMIWHLKIDSKAFLRPLDEESTAGSEQSGT